MSSVHSAFQSVISSRILLDRGFSRLSNDQHSTHSSQGTSGSSSTRACCTSPNKRTRIQRPGNMDRYRKRAILKNGHRNIAQLNMHSYWSRFIRDPFTTLVDMQWRWNLLIFILSYLLSWLFFTGFWWLIANSHDDLEEENLPHNQEKSGWVPCHTNLKDLTSFFLFSIEVQTTLGYSIRMVTDDCPESVFLMIFQFGFGMIHTAFVVGFLYTKMARAKNRTQTLIFSKKALISQRDGHFYLMFRVGDIRKSHLIAPRIRAQLVCMKTTQEGEVLNPYHIELELGMDECDENLFAKWPTVVTHRIDERSPFYDLSADDLFYESFEIVVLLEGIIEATGHLVQARTSYINDEIIWGRRFLPVLRYKECKEVLEIDHRRFNDMTMVRTPLCSPREWITYRRWFGDNGIRSGFFLGVYSIFIGMRNLLLPCFDRVIDNFKNIVNCE